MGVEARGQEVVEGGATGAAVNESEVSAAVDDALDAAGWFVVKTSQSKPTQMGPRGIPDRICFRDGVTLLLELKGQRGGLRESQIAFRDAVQPHCGKCLHYFVVYHPLQLPRWVVE